jgi:hypothetical protein
MWVQEVMLAVILKRCSPSTVLWKRSWTVIRRPYKNDGPINRVSNQIFLRAWLGIPPSHCPDWKAFDSDKTIFACYNTLERILDRHEETTQKRWTKKSYQQRIQILLKA